MNESRNIFVSYKYADTNVRALDGHSPTKVRHYVNEIEKLLDKEDHIYYGEHDGEDLSNMSEDQIWEELKDRIFPTSCTIVLISPNMKNLASYDKSQWIPWEICYSLRETQRGDKKSHRNALLAVVLPDKNGSYSYALESCTCCPTSCIIYHRDWMFTIIKENLFNRKNPNTSVCHQQSKIWHGEYSYIPMVKWDYFIGHVSSLIERAERIKEDYERNDTYELHLSVNK